MADPDPRRVHLPVVRGTDAQLGEQDVTRRSDAPTLDHILPKAKGGTDAYGNLQAAHRRCNELKADRVPAHLLESGEEQVAA